MMINGARFILVLVILIFPAAVLCGHYGLESTGLMDEAGLAKAGELGIVDTAQLFKATGTKKDRQSLATKMAVKVEVVNHWRSFCDLLRLNGVGPKIARLLTAAGITGLNDLAEQVPRPLLKRLKAKRNAVPELGKFPNETNLGSWIYQADEQVRADKAAKKAQKKSGKRNRR